MKPNFALSLSSVGIGLLHRTGASHWHMVGEVALDSADLTAELAALRKKAAALEPSGVTTKLVIPDAQIRYLDLPAGEGPEADHEAAAMHALDGATPYALDDLAFDWNVVGSRLHVAAVARETLQEAESFAREHRFNPVSFVARPETDSFGTEPFFGETSRDGARVVRDDTPIEIAGAARPKPQAPISGDDPVPQDPPTERAGPGIAGQAPTAEAATGALAGGTTEGTGGAPIRAARDVPDTGAPHLAGAARDMPGEGSQGTPVTPDPAARQAGKDGQGAVASPAAAAASLAPRREEPAVPEARGKAGTGGSRRRRAQENAPESRPSRGRDKTDPARGRDKTDPARMAGKAASQGTTPAKTPGAASAEDEADRLTIFGARETQRNRRGKPRFLGVILTTVLLLLLAGVAAWATIFPDSDLARLVRWSEPQIALTPESPDTAPSDTVPPISRQGAETGTPEAARAPEPEAIIPPGPGDPPAAAPEAAPQPPAQSQPLTSQAARARYAESGIWQIPPDPPVQPDAGSLDAFYLTSIDEDLPVGDAVALPEVPDARGDTRPETPPVPAPAGTTYQFDARGLVVATRDGALTPDGVAVFSGPPPLQPPVTPARAVPVPGLTLSPEAAADLDRISGIRPRTRPEGLIERHERGAFGGRSRTEMASLRPRPRPATLQQASAAPAAPDAIAVEAALAEAAASPGPEDGPDEAAMSQAVTASLKPQIRPDNIERIVRRQAPQQQQQQQAPQQQQQTVAPRIPSSASVAQAATARNAVNLRQVNLIGVYGSPSNRRALVRLSNGRYQKVEIGDRLDGGRVSAIGASELRYTKRGRAVVLRMPRG